MVLSCRKYYFRDKKGTVMKIAIGSDHAGYELKEYLTGHLQKRGIEAVNLGGFKPERMDYPVIGERVAGAVARGEYSKGVLICGSGVGISISANKVPGIRAVVCSEPYSAMMSRLHNDSNILAMGERVVGKELAVMILDAWLDTEFEGGRHADRVGLIHGIEEKYSDFKR
jgi:ribose 5-phosphate isomerase B